MRVLSIQYAKKLITHNCNIELLRLLPSDTSKHKLSDKAPMTTAKSKTVVILKVAAHPKTVSSTP